MKGVTGFASKISPAVRLFGGARPAAERKNSWFSGMVFWDDKGHEPVTLRTFLRSLSFANIRVAIKYSRQDPGVRFGRFDFTSRVPYPCVG